MKGAHTVARGPHRPIDLRTIPLSIFSTAALGPSVCASFPFIPSPPLSVCLALTPPLPKETRRALPGASVAVARSQPSASDWSSLIVPAVRIYSSHALGHRATPHSWPRFRLETPLPYGSGVWRRLLSNRPSILGQFDARPPPLHQAKLGTGRVAKH